MGLGGTLISNLHNLTQVCSTYRNMYFWQTRTLSMFSDRLGRRAGRICSREWHIVAQATLINRQFGLRQPVFTE